MNKEASNEKIAERLVKLRKDNLTQDEVANSLGIAKSSLANYENGFRRPKPEIMVKIANFYNQSVQAIFFN